MRHLRRLRQCARAGRSPCYSRHREGLSQHRDPASAQPLRELGPPLGSRFPDLTLPDQLGRIVDLEQDRAGRRALIVFHRSARW